MKGILKRIKRILGPLKRTIRDQERLRIKPDDVFVVSYPKSGNTWMRFFLMHAIYNPEQKPLTYADLETYIPSIHRSKSADIAKRRSPRLIKSHFLKPEYPKVLYIVRDGRDAMWSYYHYWKDLNDYQGTFEQFYFDEPFGRAGSWDAHLKSARSYQAQHPDKIHFVRYEDLLQTPKIAFRAVLDFLGKEISPDQFEFALDQTSFGALRKMQEQSGVEIDDKQVNFFRKGQSGQGNAHFTEAMLQDFETKSGELLAQFNYQTGL